MKGFFAPKIKIKKNSNKNNTELSKLRKWYSEELRRKDRIIDELKKANDLLMKTALKRSAEQEKLKSLLNEFNKKNTSK